MRWTRGYRSSNVDDRRAQGPARAFGGGGLPLGSLLAVGARFGWKGILVAIVIVGAMMYGGGSLCSGVGGDAPAQQPATTQTQSGATDDGASFVGFVLDDVQGFFGKHASRLALRVRGWSPAWLGRVLVAAAQWAAERHHARVRRELLRVDDHLSDLLAFTGRPE